MIRPYTTRGNKEEYDISIVDSGKGWKRTHGNVDESLKSLSKDLPRVPDNTAFKRSDISVPSPWASIISFDIILKDNEGEFGALSKAAVNEWRSLLSLIALRKLYGYDLDIKEIELSSSDNNSDEAFYSNILSLAPKKNLFKNSLVWEKFSFLMFDQTPIGAFSNATLVVSNYELEESNATKKLKELGFIDSQLNFINPVDIFKNDLVLSIYMSKWLEKLKENIPEIPAGDRTGSIIDKFIDDLKDNYLYDKVIYNELIASDFLSFTFDFEDGVPQNSYELLWHINVDKFNLNIPEVQKKIKVGKITSPVFILEKLGENVVKLINILGERCIKPEGTFWDSNSVFLNNISLVKYFDDKNGFDNNENFCTIDSVGADGEHRHEKYSYILPIKENVLDNFSTDAIRDTVSITSTEESIIVTLNFELENGEKCPLSKTYSKSTCNKLTNDDLPTIAIWPYAIVFDKNDSTKKNLWKDYYIFKAYNASDTKYTTKVKCDWDSKDLEFEDMSRINKDYTRGTANSEKIPNYLSIYKMEYSYSGELLKEDNIGVIILPKPKIECKIDYDVEYIVGFDFGTTSTTAFCARTGDEVDRDHKFVQLGQTVQTPTDGESAFAKEVQLNDVKYIGNSEDGSYIAYNNFMVERDAIEPELSFVPGKYPARKSYMSMFKRNTNAARRSINPDESLKYGNILFDQRYFRLVEEYVNRNLKWNKDQNEQLSLAGYINQIMKAITFTFAKDGIGNVNWRISYPTSLSKEALKTYKDITKNAIDNIENISGVHSAKDDILPYCPESIVSAKFKEDPSGDYICIDIGGGSTDVSLWKKNLSGGAMINIMQFSIGIASRKIFLADLADAIINPKKEYENKKNDRGSSKNQVQIPIVEILKNNDVREDNSVAFENVIAKIKDAPRLNDRSVNKKMDEFASIIEPLLQTSGERIHTIIGYETEVKKQFEKVLLVGFWGILYYTAISISKYKEELSDSNKINIYLAGNGSMLYDWIDEDYQENLRKAFSDVLNKHLGRASDKEIRIDRFILDKENLKTEAARGLLKMDNRTNIDDLLKTDSLINGGKCTVIFKNGNQPAEIDLDDVINDREHSYFSEFFEGTSDSNISDIKVNSPEDDLKEFINKMNEYIFDKYSQFKLNDDEKFDLIDRVNTAIDINHSSGTVAPVFILELEALLRTILGY